jgi:trimethylamine:corrinoid methyltransferase-like protein
MPDVIDRKRYDTWVKDGSKDMFQRANARAREILAEAEPVPLPEEAEAAIRDVLEHREQDR